MNPLTAELPRLTVTNWKFSLNSWICKCPLLTNTHKNNGPTCYKSTTERVPTQSCLDWLTPVYKVSKFSFVKFPCYGQHSTFLHADNDIEDDNKADATVIKIPWPFFFDPHPPKKNMQNTWPPRWKGISWLKLCCLCNMPVWHIVIAMVTSNAYICYWFMQ